MQIGSYLLEKVHFPSGAPSAEWRARLEKFIRDNPRDPAAKQLVARGTLRDSGDLAAERAFVDVGWLIAWSAGAFQRVVVGSKLAAAFMATNAGDDPDVMLERPWNAFTIEIPPELVRMPLSNDITVSMDVIAVWHHPPDSKSRYIVYSRSSMHTFVGELEWPLPKFVALEDVPVSRKTKASAERARECIVRLIVATQLEMTNHMKDASLAEVRSETKKKKGIKHTTHHLARDVKVECQEDIARYISGESRKSPTVRTLVRGHWQRYHVGRGRVFTVWLHKEPKWRNIGAARLAVRPHRFAGDVDDTDQ